MFDVDSDKEAENVDTHLEQPQNKRSVLPHTSKPAVARAVLSVPTVIASVFSSKTVRVAIVCFKCRCC